MTDAKGAGHAVRIDGRALIVVAHGSPSDPGPQEDFVRNLAALVAERTGAVVRGATLARAGSLEAAVEGLNSPVVYPHFMSDGWFVSTNLQRRLAGAGLTDWTTLTPLGMDPALPKLAEERLKAELVAADLLPGQATLVVAAHGSPSDPRPSQATEAFASVLARGKLFAGVKVGYVDEAPELKEAARVEGPALVLPFFAAKAGHVLSDLPEALAEAAFEGRVLDPIGTWDVIPDVIAGAFGRDVSV